MADQCGRVYTRRRPMVLPRPSRLPALLCLLVALVAAAYANSLRGPFTLDDRTEVVDNASIEDLGQPLVVLRHNLTRPLTNVTYALDYAAWGGRNVVGFHVTNVLLHAIDVVLLFLLVRRLARDAPGASDTGMPDVIAFVAASLFAVHPLLTEAVSYVSGRSDLLATVLFLAGVYAFRRAFDDGARWLAAGWAAFLCGLAVKETAAMLPFVVLALDMLLMPASGRASRLRRVHVPLLSLVFVAGLARVWLYVAVETPGAMPASWRAAVLAVDVISRYVMLFVLPIGQTVVHAVAPIASLADSRVLTAGIFAVSYVAVLAATWRRRPLVAFGLVWFALALLPSSALSLLAEVGQPMAEHRVYLGACGLFMSVAAFAVPALYVRAARRAALTIAFGAVVVVLAVLTVERNRVWADTERLWLEAVRISPTTPASHLGLAAAYRARGEFEPAQAAYTQAIALRPAQADGYLGLAECLLEEGRAADAAVALRLASVRVPQSVTVRLVLAALEERAFGNRDDARRLCAEALAIDPRSRDAAACVARIDAGR